MKIRTVILMLILSASVFAKDFFYVDYSCFRTFDDSKTRTDIYISIPIAYLDFDKEMTSLFSMKVFIYDGEKLVTQDMWKQKYKIASEADKYSGAEIPVLSKLELPPGYYRLVIEVE
ncbi:MAG: hypothetical protein PHF33_11100, partial [Candidatus Delongbacteria bacterium]|nr:hypothetical protein [Candidatus Delongbacteria bacterium]